jgi:hypothetical protein
MTGLDRYLDDLGARLEAAAGTADGAERSRGSARAGRAAGVGLAVAALAAGVLALSWSRPDHPPRPLNALAEARAALSTDGAILYMRVRSGGGVTDQWSTEHPLRWRIVSHSPSVGRTESAYAGGATSVYYADAGLLNRTTGYADDAPQARLRTIFGIGTPDTSIPALLAAGKLVDKGEVQDGTRTVRRLEHGDKDRDVVYDVDPKTFAPVGGSFTFYRPGHVLVDTTSFTVERYERIPLTRADAHLLAITPKPSDRVTTLTAPQFMAAWRKQRRFERNCGKHHIWTQACRTPKGPFPTPAPPQPH